MKKIFIEEVSHNYSYTGKKILVTEEAYKRELKRCRDSRWGNTQYMYTCKTEACRRLSVYPELRG